MTHDRHKINIKKDIKKIENVPDRLSKTKRIVIVIISSTYLLTYHLLFSIIIYLCCMIT